jgi:predicted transposase YbfD/YdcC
LQDEKLYFERNSVKTAEKGHGRIEKRAYYLTTLTDVKIFAKAVRSHWGIENSLHRCLDVSFNEDKSTIRTCNTIENFSVVRRIALNILTPYQPPAAKEKMSVKVKRKKCEYDCEFMADVLLSAF